MSPMNLMNNADATVYFPAGMIRSDSSTKAMYVQLPVREAFLSCGRTTETINNDQVLVNVDRINGVVVGIEVVVL